MTIRVAWVSPALHQGGGHVSRALAFVRAARRARADFEIGVFGPDSGRASRWFNGLHETNWEDRTLLDPLRCMQTHAAQTLAAWRPDLVIVDVLWLPVQTTLQQLGVPAWLLVRDVPPTWLRGPQLQPFVPTAWTRILAIEPWRRDSFPNLLQIPPVMTTNPNELFPPDALHTRLGLADPRPIAVIAQTGQPHEHAALQPFVRKDCQVIHLSMHSDTALVPLAPWLAGATQILGGAGYNLFWETHWLGLADRTHLIAFPRNNDDQAWRLQTGGRLQIHLNGADVLVRAVRAG